MDKRGKTLHMGGKLLTLVQLILSAGLLIVIWNSGVLPMRYIIAAAVVMLVLFGITFGLQFLRNKIYIAGIVLSMLISAGMGIGIVYMLKADKLMEDVGGASYKTDNMIVVVKKESPASNLLDAKGYRFGMQKSVDQENNRLMKEDIEKALGQEIKIEEYATPSDEAEALLKGRIEAAIYNEAFAGIIDDAVEGYSDQVRILYQYGINTEIEQKETNIQKPFNVYISGIDVDGPITTNSRSDVNIIMTVNPNTRKILLTTTPRDYYVPILGVSGEQKDKLTHAGIYGVDVSMKTLESIYKIDISYYARVNFTSLIHIVDALGGVDVNSEYAFTTTHGSYEIKKGINHMDGAIALGFSRERYSFEAGDNQRGKNQEAVLTAILNKAMSPAILTNANQIIASVGDSVETNMTQEEMAKFINLQLSDSSAWSIESAAATGTGDNQTCFSSGDEILYVMNPNEQSIQEISKKMAQVAEEK
ncbi:LCP family glycopolymer transferase [Clostridium sp. C105KSO13]|uniref:LCP family glycopolymer transferase n=1 Tax=Clostridium sp. C105KSO13 TaxID=1776045 RepID=UPI0007407690|nr:LCP family protein [Clostridium sp. C105KSO13]CUX45971.1 Transcriptional regulator LytR [Clostridium sp. C105KSO13]